MIKNMRVFLVMGLCCVLSTRNGAASDAHSYLAQVGVQESFLDAPIFVNDSRLSVRLFPNYLVNAPSVARATIEVRIFGKAGESALINRINRSLSSDEMSACFQKGSKSCALRLVSLPIGLERSACQVRLSIQAPGLGDLINPVTLPWGRCQAQPAPDVPGRSVALSWDDSGFIAKEVPQAAAPFPRDPGRQISLPLKNSGSAAFRKASRMIAIGYDQNENVIWSSSLTFSGEIATGASDELTFSNLLRPWQWHRLCSVRLIADVDNQVYEDSKSGDDTVLSSGLCETDPDTDPSKRPDLAAWAEWDGANHATLHILNLGVVKAPRNGIPIELRFELSDKFGRILEQNRYLFHDAIEPYGADGAVTWTFSPSSISAGACALSFEVDPRREQADSNWTNNRTLINLCKNQ